MRNLLRSKSLVVAALLLAITMLSGEVFSAEPAGAMSVSRRSSTVVRSSSNNSLAISHVASLTPFGTLSLASQLWPKLVGMYGGYETYRRRTDRKIPVVLLKPVGEVSQE